MGKTYLKSFILGVILLLIGISAFVALYYHTTFYQDTGVIDKIIEMQRGPNKFWDLGDEIGVTSADDLGYRVYDTGIINIYYGKQIISIKPASLKSKTFMQSLEAIGIKIQQHEDKFRVTYWGEEIDQWVNS